MISCIRRTRGAGRPGRRSRIALRLAILVCAASFLAPRSRAQGNISVEHSVQLFSTLCALQAAGYESHVAVATDPARVRLRGQMLGLDGPAVRALRDFYRSHRSSDSAATLSRYITFALVAGPPPNFTFTLNHDQLPPDALALQGFNELLAAFHREANIEELWKSFQGDYVREIGRLRDPVGEIILVATTYAREILSAGKGPAFTVYVEPLVGAKTSVRSIADHYSIVLDARTDSALDDIRHAYLHFLLDPMVIRHPAAVRSREALLLFAAKAPRLSADYKNDFSSLVSECLVKAVELRLARRSGEKLSAAFAEADRDGFVLVRPLHAGLEYYEQSEPGMGQYFPDLMKRISVTEEARRLQSVEFAPAAAASAGEKTDGPGPSETELWLLEGERHIAAQDGAAAAQQFERVLAREPGQPRGLYGMAMASILQGDSDRARELFVRLIQSGQGTRADARLLAWSHVYLGRIHDVEGKRDLAVSEYRAALNVAGAPEAARAAARRGVEKGYESPAGPKGGPVKPH